VRLSVESASSGTFAIFADETHLHTNMGGRHPVFHHSSLFLEHMVAELHERGKLTIANGQVEGPQGFDSYSLYSLQKDWVEPGRDNLSTNFLLEMIHEPLLEFCASPSTWHILPFRESASVWVHELGARLVDLDLVDHSNLEGIPDEHFRLNDNLGNDDHEAFLTLTAALARLYTSMSSEQKSVATYLTNISNGFLIYSLRLAAGQCSPDDYGRAFAAVQHRHRDETMSEATAYKASNFANRAIRFLELATPQA
jgi:hypothetical protein